MGNSEVGHLTIGSGRVLFQDLMRVNVAVRDGSIFENAALARRVRAGEGARRGRAPAGPRLAGRRPLAHRPPARAARAGPARGDGRPDVDPRVHRRPRRLARTRRSPTSRACPAERIATVVGRYYAMDRDNRAERTERAVAAILDGRGRARRRPGRRRRRELRARRRPTSSSSRSSSPAAPRLDPATDAAIFFNFRPDRGRQLSRRLLERGVDLTTMTRYAEDIDDTGRVPRAARGRHARRDAQRRRHPPAARGRDREVRARHLLLQRRRGGRVGGGDAGARAVAARRRELRPEARDVRGGRRRRGRATRCPTATASASSTSRIPTWSATRV